MEQPQLVLARVLAGHLTPHQAAEQLSAFVTLISMASSKRLFTRGPSPEGSSFGRLTWRIRFGVT
jgi:hypothetical protein